MKVSKNKNKTGSYYMPFQNRNKGHRTYSCNDLVTVYDCATSSLCTWNSRQKKCKLNRFSAYSFKENKENKENKIKK